MRVVVVNTPPRAEEADVPRPALVALEWAGPQARLTVALRSEFRIERDGALTPEREPDVAWEDEPWELPGAEGELYAASDLAPHKPRCDVQLVGEAAGDADAAGRLAAFVRVGAWSRRLFARSSAPAPRLPLARRYLVGEDGRPAPPCGPLALEAGALERAHFPEDFSFDELQAADPLQQRAHVEPGEPVEVTGVGGDLSFSIPARWPRVLAEWKGSAPPAELVLALDTVWIDARTRRLALVWRGVLALPFYGSVERLYVHVDDARDPAGWDRILRRAARGDLCFAMTRELRTAEPTTEEERDALAEARWDLALQDRAPEPLLPLERYAAISAELAEGREPRAVVLERHGFAEPSWLVEERGWLEALAEGAEDGDATLAADYSEAFVKAQDALAGPEEELRGLPEWAEIAAALESTEDPAKELEARRLRLSEWLRLERRVRARGAADPAFAERAEEALERARAATGGAST